MNLQTSSSSSYDESSRSTHPQFKIPVVKSNLEFGNCRLYALYDVSKRTFQITVKYINNSLARYLFLLRGVDKDLKTYSYQLQ